MKTSRTPLQLWRLGRAASTSRGRDRTVESLAYESYGPKPADTHTRKSRLGVDQPYPLAPDLYLRSGPIFSRAPALAATEYGVDMAWRDPDRKLRVLRAAADGEPRETVLSETSADGKGPSKAVRLGQTTFYAPALTNHGGHLVLAWTGSDGRIRITDVLI